MLLMKEIKINFIGFWSDFNKENNLFMEILRKQFRVTISESPDFVICSALGKPFDYLKYDCVRILYTGEPLCPDFNVFDYAIGFDRIEFGDRCFRYPYGLYNIQKAEHCIPLTREDAEKALREKEFFCNFIYGHKSAYGERERLLETLSKYKRVECAGTLCNNMNDGKTVTYSGDKIDFVRRCKFTIACDSVAHPGFVTEKIRDAFIGNSIPIYFGDPYIAEEYNTKAFINCRDFDSFEAVLERVKELDQDDEQYMQMLMEQKYKDADYVEKKRKELEHFLYNIFSQEPKQAYRRLRFYASKYHEDYMNEYRKLSDSKVYKIYKRLFK